MNPTLLIINILCINIYITNQIIIFLCIYLISIVLIIILFCIQVSNNQHIEKLKQVINADKIHTNQPG